MEFSRILILILVAASATGVVLTRNPVSQAVTLSFYGLVMSLMFFIYQAPDVALSQVVIGAVTLPLLVLLALAKIKRDSR